MLSLTKLEQCPCCSSENIVKNGFTKPGNQRVLCHDCDKSRILHRKFSHDFDFEAVAIPEVFRPERLLRVAHGTATDHHVVDFTG